jgi:hypothetical protein
MTLSPLHGHNISSEGLVEYSELSTIPYQDDCCRSDLGTGHPVKPLRLMELARHRLTSRPASGREAEALEARRMLVCRNMFELMRQMGRADKFKDPDDWLDSIVPRRFSD